IAEEELVTQAPEFWDDPKKAELVLKQIKQQKNWTEAYTALEKSVEDLSLTYDFYKQEAVTEKELDEQFKGTTKLLSDLEFKNMLGSPEDHLNAVIEINSGAGG